MKVLLSNINKENNMEENNEVVGLKVNVQNVNDDSVEDVTENTEEAVEETVENKITIEKVDDDTIEDTGTLGEIFAPLMDDVTEKTINEDESGFYKLLACARLFGETGTTLYRFDIFYREFEENSGIFEFRNIVDNFEAARPKNSKEYKDFFAVIGIIRWNFHNKYMPINQNSYVSITTIESAINEHIKIAGIKKDKFIFRIDTIAED